MLFEEFVQHCSTRLFRTALLLTGQDRSAAEDLLQVALERAYRHWGRIGRQDEPERYVRRILANASTDRWRRARRRPERPMTDCDAGPVSPDQADAIADRDFLLRALAALPPRQRAALVLRCYNGMPDAEIADALSCSVGTVRSQISRGLAQIRAASAEAAPRAAGQTGGRADGR